MSDYGCGSWGPRVAAKGAPESTGLALMLSEISTPRAETSREAGGGGGCRQEPYVIYNQNILHCTETDILKFCIEFSFILINIQ